jgi:hypothetical protein
VDWEGSGRKRSWLNLATISKFAWRDWEKPRKAVVITVVSRPKFEMKTARIQVQIITATPAVRLDCHYSYPNCVLLPHQRIWEAFPTWLDPPGTSLRYPLLGKSQHALVVPQCSRSPGGAAYATCYTGSDSHTYLSSPTCAYATASKFLNGHIPLKWRHLLDLRFSRQWACRVRCPGL